MKERRKMMKKIKKNSLSTDYFFESLFRKVKAFLLTNLAAKLSAIKLLTIVSWFKDIN
jgi:hypothetical protein